MCLNYFLLYVQLEEMQTRARHQGGVSYIKKESHERLQAIFNWVTLGYICCFILTQVVMLYLSYA